MAFVITWEPPHGAYRKFTGHLGDEELVRSISIAYGDSRFDDLRYVIDDFLDVESYSIQEDTILYIAAMDGAAARSNPDIVVAIVIAESQQKALATLYATSPSNAYPTRIFTDLAEARAWVDQAHQPDSNP